MTQNYSATLCILGGRGQIDGSANDVRGRQVKNGDGIVHPAGLAVFPISRVSRN